MLKTILGLTTSIGVSQVVPKCNEVTTPDNLSKFKRLPTV